MDGPDKCAGRVEVLHEKRWGSVCDDQWDMKDAEVVCKQMGCGSPLSALGNARYGRGSDIIWLDDVQCNGTEESIFECPARPLGEHNCYHGEDADVVCAGTRPPPRKHLKRDEGQPLLGEPAGWTEGGGGGGCSRQRPRKDVVAQPVGGRGTSAEQGQMPAAA